MPLNTRYEEVGSHEIGEVWTGQSVRFPLVTHGDDQFIAFYAADRSITVGHRRLGGTDWSLSTVSQDRNDPWDHHNSLALAIDDDGHLHLVGDLHVDPINYFRTTSPMDITSFERIESMVGEREHRATYPCFLQGPDGELIFKYRDGSSGAGDWIFNVYDSDTREWHRLLDEPLTAGGEQASAYHAGPTVGPDGRYHLVWCWRDNPAAQTNHDLYYVRSDDLRNWEKSTGVSVHLPIGLPQGELIDPVPPYGGLLNSRIRLGFDASDRVVVTYMKYDPDGNTQVYNARRESEGWKIYQTSDWDYRYTFGGGGTLGTPLDFSGVQIESSGRLSQTYDHPKYGRAKWLLDEATLQPVEWRSPWFRYPAAIRRPTADVDYFHVNWTEVAGSSPADHQPLNPGRNGTVHALRWESMDPRDGREMTRDERDDLPSSTLEFYEFTCTD